MAVNGAPQEIKDKIVELVKLYMKNNEEPLEEYVTVEINEQGREKLVVVEVHGVRVGSGIKQMARPSIANVSRCECCGKPR